MSKMSKIELRENNQGTTSVFILNDGGLGGGIWISIKASSVNAIQLNKNNGLFILSIYAGSYEHKLYYDSDEINILDNDLDILNDLIPCK